MDGKNPPNITTPERYIWALGLLYLGARNGPHGGVTFGGAFGAHVFHLLSYIKYRVLYLVARNGPQGPEAGGGVFIFGA